MVGESRLRAHVVFKHPPNRPKFLTLADLVTILHEESRDYRLLSVCRRVKIVRLSLYPLCVIQENCYFFTSVIQELLTDLHGGEVVSGALGHRKLGAVVRRRVRKRFATMATYVQILRQFSLVSSGMHQPLGHSLAMGRL